MNSRVTPKVIQRRIEELKRENEMLYENTRTLVAENSMLRRKLIGKCIGVAKVFGLIATKTNLSLPPELAALPYETEEVPVFNDERDRRIAELETKVTSLTKQLDAANLGWA